MSEQNGMLKQVRRILMIVAGVTVLLIGIAMVVLPGPAIIVIPIGLAMLGTEFAWARWLNKKMKAKAKQIGSAIMGGGKKAEEKTDEKTEVTDGKESSQHKKIKKQKSS